MELILSRKHVAVGGSQTLLNSDADNNPGYLKKVHWQIPNKKVRYTKCYSLIFISKDVPDYYNVSVIKNHSCNIKHLAEN